MARQSRGGNRFMRVFSWMLAAAFLGFTAYVYFHNPFESSVTFCTFHALTGLDCPGCGMTRAAYLLLHGHPLQALSQNPFILVIPVVGYMALAELSPYLFGRQIKKLILPNWLLIALGALVVVFTLARNIPKFL
jgi:hypothetical protein